MTDERKITQAKEQKTFTEAELNKSVTVGDLQKAMQVAEDHFAKRFAFKEHDHVKYQLRSERVSFHEYSEWIVIGLFALGAIIADIGVWMMSASLALILGGLLLIIIGMGLYRAELS